MPFPPKVCITYPCFFLNMCNFTHINIVAFGLLTHVAYLIMSREDTFCRVYLRVLFSY